MSGRAGLWIIAILLVLVAGLWLGGGTGAVSSTLSRGADGWLAARRYLEARGASLTLHDGPLTSLATAPSPAQHTERTGSVLVLAFPWQQAIEPGEGEAIGRFLHQGGTVLVAYSGQLGNSRESRILDALQLVPDPARAPPPLAPRRWWAYQDAVWNLTPTEASQDLPTLAIGAPRAVPRAPPRARVLYRSPATRLPLIFDYPLNTGRVVVLPAALFSNSQISRAGNADFLESLLGWLGEHWIFDEYHHGLIDLESLPEASSRFAWDLFIVHLVLIYLLGLAALTRRFGPAWQTTAVGQGSTGAFLRHLGSLHHDLAHHRDAARLLIDRARAHDPTLSFDEAIIERAGRVDEARKLLELARDVGTIQRRSQT